VVIFTHSRDGKLISCQAVSDSNDGLNPEELDQAAKLLFEMAYQGEEKQSA
jgi:hypothetical protein